MSDYLWDKKGEPDAEVARLEALLGAFAHEPRRLVLPAEAAAPEPRLPWPLLFSSRLFAPAALAAAVALLVVSVLAASAFLRARVATEGQRAHAPGSPRPKGDAGKDAPPAPRADEQAMLEPPPPVGGEDKTTSLTVQVKDEGAAVESLRRVARRRRDAQVAAVSGRRTRLPTAETATGEGLTLEKMSTRAGASELVENARLLTKEQLVYALRLTGAKLKDVREKAQGAEGSRQ